MEDMILNIILIIFPILMYLVFSCYNSLNNKRITKIIFIITMCSSLYLSLRYNINNKELLVFCNIPILICYFKKEKILGLVLSLIMIVYGYIKYDINIYIIFVKYFGYFLVYLLLCNKKEFNYLFLKISGIIQGFFISFEYFINYYGGVNKLILLMIYVIIIYGLTFFALYLFKLADNISSLYLMNNQLVKDSKLKESLFKLTHEIKNPIAVCKGYLDMIDLSDIVKSKKYINIIRTEIDRSLNVMADFMEYSKIKINRDVMDLVMLLDDVYESFDILVRDKNIKFNYNNRYDEVYYMGDYDRLKQVFVNVIKNSIESINNDGIINIDVYKIDNNIKVIISDNGLGMDEEELDNIKKIFFTTKKNGTGLGVALSNEIIMAHNGMIDYESVKNKGTKCIITLPIEE